MERLGLAALCATSILIVPGLAETQSSAAQDGVRPGKVYVTGENPGIQLLDKENGTVLTGVSYWRIVWSPVGAGHVCYVTTGDGKSPGDLRIAFIDNQKLYDFLTREIMVTIDSSISGRPFTVVRATFDDPGEGTFDASGAMKDRTVTMKSANYAVALVWRDFSEPYQIDLPVGQAPNRFVVTSLFIPAKSADVTINGKKAAGNVYPSKGFLPSTAFLAFSESWLK